MINFYTTFNSGLFISITILLTCSSTYPMKDFFSLFNCATIEIEDSENNLQTPYDLIKKAYQENEIVELIHLLEKCDTTNSKKSANLKDLNIILLAAQRNSFELMLLLLKHDGQKKFINRADEDNNTPLYYALDNNNLRMAKILLNNGAKIYNGINGNNLLKIAINKENETIVKLLLDNGAMDQYDTLPFASAIETANSDILRLLLQKSTKNINRINHENKTLVQIALKQDERTPLIKLLVQYGADLTQDDKGNLLDPLPLASALDERDYDLVEFILENSPTDFNSLSLSKYICADGDTLIHKAIKKNDLEMVKILKRYGADINLPNKDGLTPLYFAVDKGALDISKFLLDNGSQGIINNTYERYFDNKHLSTVLNLAIANNDFKMFNLLLDYGAQSNNDTLKAGEKPFEIALLTIKQHRDNLPMIAYLLEKVLKI